MTSFWNEKEEDEYASNMQYINEADYFFRDEDGQIPTTINPKIVDQIQEQYFKILFKTFDWQKQKFENFRDQCLEEEQVKLLKDEAKVTPLILPG